MLLARGFLLLALCAGAVGATPPGFAPCPEAPADLRATCGTVSVPEDPARPEGRRIDLNVMVLAAAAPTGAPPLFLLAGGPGQGATDLAGLVVGPYAEVRENRDVVLVDQRGTGRSHPLTCACPAENGDPQAVFGHLFDSGMLARCREETADRADPRLYGTLQVVADLEAVREALGYDRVTLWGGSGGTRTALVWMREHPAHVAAAVLDGVVSTDFGAPSTYARTSQDALDRVFADCAADPDCRRAFPAPRDDFASLLAMFADGPVPAAVTVADGTRHEVRMSRGDFGYAVRGMLYRADGIAALPGLIHQAAESRDLDAFAQAYWERNVQICPYVAEGVHLSVFGTEDIPFIDDADVAGLTAGTFLGTYLIDEYRAASAAWDGRGALPETFRDPVRVDVPVLLVSGYYDPTTPPHVAAGVASHLPHSRHVVVRNEGHGAGFGCARQAVLDFLRGVALEDLGDVCADAGPVAFEVPGRSGP